MKIVPSLQKVMLNILIATNGYNIMISQETALTGCESFTRRPTAFFQCLYLIPKEYLEVILTLKSEL